MSVQLRIYTINRGALERFTEEWGEKIRPLRVKMGFDILGAWTIPEQNQFLWLLEYNGRDDWEDADEAYYNSEERRSMQPDPARHIARIEHYFVNTVR